MDAFDALIDRYGWRAESWTDLLTPTWAEDPAVPLARVVRYLDEPQHTAQAAHVRSAEVRQRAIEDALARLTDGEQRATFEALVEEVSWVTRTREGRARLQLMASGVLRKPLSELGTPLGGARTAGRCERRRDAARRRAAPAGTRRTARRSGAGRRTALAVGASRRRCTHPGSSARRPMRRRRPTASVPGARRSPRATGCWAAPRPAAARCEVSRG